MKQIQKLWAGALMLLALSTACSKEEAPSPVEPSQPTTKQVYADLTIGGDGLRAVYDVATDGSGSATHLQLERDVVLYLAVKNELGDVVYNTPKTFVRTGRNTARYAGQITTPATGTSFSIAAILLGEAGNESRFAAVDASDPSAVNVVAATPFNPVSHNAIKVASSQVDAPVPYVAGWSTARFNATGTVLEPVELTLKPQGTLLRFRVRNTTSTPISVSKVRINTTAFDRGGYFSFVKDNAGQPTELYFTATSRPVPVDYVLPEVAAVPAAVGGQPGYSEWFYTWVMPSKSYEINTSVDLILENGTLVKNAFTTNRPLSHGSVPVTFSYTGTTGVDFLDLGEVGHEWGSTSTPRLALDYFAEGDVSVDLTTFETAQSSTAPNRGFFTWAEAMTNFKDVKTYGAGTAYEGQYSLPTLAEAKSLFPVHHPDFVSTTNPYGHPILVAVDDPQPRTNIIERGVKIGAVTKDYANDYRYVNRRVCYAVRFKDNSNYNRTAFRYAYIGTMSSNTYALEVRARYLGNSSATIDDVATETYWSTPDATEVKRIFTAAGQYLASNPSTKVQEMGLVEYWTTEAVDPDRSYVFSFVNGRAFTHPSFNSTKNVVRLIKRNLSQP